MDRVVNSPLDPVIVFLLLGVAIGFLHFDLEMPKGWRDGI